MREDGNNYSIQESEARKRTAILDINALADISLLKKVRQVPSTHKIIYLAKIKTV